ncbi:hypothetical protein KIPB_009649, partial [Kipferlia bialata]|eukprot:g9649.t1
MASASMQRLDMAGWNLAKLNLKGVNLSGCDLTGCDIKEANITGAILDGCILSGCKHLTEAQLVSAHLPGLICHGQRLRDFDFGSSSLERVDFSSCDLTNANLSGCAVAGLKLYDVTLAETTMPKAQADLTHIQFQDIKPKFAHINPLGPAGSMNISEDGYSACTGSEQAQWVGQCTFVIPKTEGTQVKLRIRTKCKYKPFLNLCIDTQTARRKAAYVA